MNEQITQKLSKIQQNSQAIEALYARLNQVYDSLNTKMGLIATGFTTVTKQLEPYLGSFEQREAARRAADKKRREERAAAEKAAQEAEHQHHG